jgi:HD-like signal output (HDOD) protein
MFQGDIAQFAPADLLLFLCHMNKEGVLCVRQGEASLSLAFRRHLLVDGGCEAAEELVLEMLSRGQAAAPEALAYLRQAREETGLPLAHILDDVAWLSVMDADQAIAAGMRETVFRLLLWESGTFQFTEIPVDDNPHLAPLDGPALVMDLTREVDEYRELLRGLGSLERRVRVVVNPVEASAEERYVLAHAGKSGTARELLGAAPFPRLRAAAAVATAVDRGWLEFAAATGAVGVDADDVAGTFSVLPAYRLALRRLLQAVDDEARYREVVSFAQTHCTQSILFGVSAGCLKRATVYRRDATGRLTASDYRDPEVALTSDMVFHQALVAGRPFVGTVFPSPVIDALGARVPAVDCALLPLGRLAGLDLLLYAVTAEPSTRSGPLACLELLSWQVHAPQIDRPAAVLGRQVGAGRTDGASRRDESLLTDSADAVDKLVASIRDLPPMPNVMARILELLTNPDCELKSLVDALSCDPALVARLIKVGNSSLYGGYQDVGSVNQAILRLGMRTTRSVVMAASTHALFPMDDTRRGLLGRSLWEHAVRSGLAARRVAEFTRRADPDEAFAAGVLHDVGKVIILLNKPEEYAEVQRRLEQGAPDSVTTEREILGFDHCGVGDLLLSNWSMPGSLRIVARCHHDPVQAGEMAALVQVVACGELLSRRLCDRNGAGSRLEERLAATYAALGLDASACSDLEELLPLDLDLSDLLD